MYRWSGPTDELEGTYTVSREHRPSRGKACRMRVHGATCEMTMPVPTSSIEFGGYLALPTLLASVGDMMLKLPVQYGLDAAQW